MLSNKIVNYVSSNEIGRQRREPNVAIYEFIPNLISLLDYLKNGIAVRTSEKKF